MVALTGWPYYDFHWTVHEETDYPVLLTIDGHVPETLDMRLADLRSYPQYDANMTVGGVPVHGTGVNVTDLLNSTGLTDRSGLGLRVYGNTSDGGIAILYIQPLDNIFDGTFTLVLTVNNDNTVGLIFQDFDIGAWFAKVNRITVTVPD